MSNGYSVMAAREELEALECELEVVVVASSDDQIDIHESISVVCSRILERVRNVRVNLLMDRSSEALPR